MKWYSEEEILRRAGLSESTPELERDAAANLIMSNRKVLEVMIALGDFKGIRALQKTEVRHLRIKRAVEWWQKTFGAIYDPHRQKWLVLNEEVANGR